MGKMGLGYRYRTRCQPGRLRAKSTCSTHIAYYVIVVKGRTGLGIVTASRLNAEKRDQSRQKRLPNWRSLTAAFASVVAGESSEKTEKWIVASRKLSGKRVVLTGASSGIGWYLATQLIGLGASVVVDGRREERLRDLRLSVGNSRKLIAIPGDLCCSDHRKLLINTAVERLGGVDLLINNAGIGAIGAFEQASPERLRQILEVDFFAAAELTRLAIPHLKKGHEPAICNVNSVLGYRGVPGKSEYCAAKFAMRGWTESLRIEMKSCGIDVVSISPSTTRSEFFSSLIQTDKSAKSPSLGAQSSEQVARSIIKALKRRRLDSVLSPGGKALVWLSQLLPRVTDNLLLRYAT